MVNLFILGIQNTELTDPTNTICALSFKAFDISRQSMASELLPDHVFQLSRRYCLRECELFQTSVGSLLERERKGDQLELAECSAHK